MPYQKVNDINIYYEIHGPQGADLVVLSNGIFMSTASWAYQIAELEKHFQVLVYDCRGMWQSDHPESSYSMDLHADDLAILLRSLGYSKAHIAGISYGGEISMVFAARYPEMTRSLIVSSSVSQLDPLLQAVGRSWTGALASGDAGTLFDVTLPFNFSEEWIAKNEKLLQASRKRYEDMDLVAAGRLMAAFSEIHFSEDLKNIKSPALVLVGELDILKPRKYSEIIANEIAGSEFVVIPGGGHAICLEKPQIFNSIVLGFIVKHCEVMK